MYVLAFVTYICQHALFSCAQCKLHVHVHVEPVVYWTHNEHLFAYGFMPS